MEVKNLILVVQQHTWYNMSDKLDRKEEAAGLQYIRKFLVPLAAKDLFADWEPTVQVILKDLHRINDQASFLGRGMTDLLFYDAKILIHPITFRIGKYLGQPIVSYYHAFRESKWYRIGETPDKSAIRTMTESEHPQGPSITKMEEHRALQFIRNAGIPYCVDKIYNPFLSEYPQANMTEYPRVGYDAFRKNLRKVQVKPHVITYITKVGTRVEFIYYIKKLSYDEKGIHILIHNSVSGPGHSLQDIGLYIDNLPRWFKQLGYLKEAHNPQRHTLDINQEEEIDATRTFIQHVLPDAVRWFNGGSSWSGKKRKQVTVDEVRRGLKKVVRNKDFILFKFSLSDNKHSDEQLWFAISKKIFDNGIISIGYHIKEILMKSTTFSDKGFEEEDFKTGWHWRQYIPDKKSWDVFLNETSMEPDNRSNVTKMEEAQAVQWIRDHLFKYVAKEIGASEKQLRDTFKKIKHDNRGSKVFSPYIFYQSQTGLLNYPNLDFVIYRDDKNRINIGVDNIPGWHMSFLVGSKEHLAELGCMNENELPSDQKFDISKREEAQALQYFRSLIPQVTKELNLYIASGASGIKFNVNRLTSEESISNNLKKTEHRKQIFSSKRGPQDYIEYTSQEIGRPPVVFYIFKTYRDIHDPESGIKIAVGYKHFNPRNSGGTTSYLTENDPKHPGESDENYVNRVVKISSREEAEGLHFIKKFLFKKVCNSWNASAAASNHTDLFVSPDEISKHFVKTERRFTPVEKQMERHAHDKVTYTSHLRHKKGIAFPKGLVFTFYISKSDDGILMVCFVTPGRSDSGSCYGIHQLIKDKGKLEESTIKVGRISKKEEAEALHYIRRVLGPYAVSLWNNETRQHQFKSDGVINQLKKVRHSKPGEDNVGSATTDYIEYETKIPVRDVTLKDRVFFMFYIWKNKHNQLVVRFITNLIDGGPYVVGSNPVKQHFSENVEKPQENSEPKFSIPKIDEFRAVDFIKKLIVPMAVKRWNRIYKPHGELSIDKVRKSMKKTKHNALFVVYTSETTIPSHKIHWEIWKDSTGKLMVGWRVSNESFLHAAYFVDSPSPIDEDVGSDLKAKYSITRKEEDFAADFIKKRLIPELVEFINDVNHHYTRHRQITIEEVLKTFKKIGVFDSKFGYRREIQYQALFLGEPFLFDIFKDSDSKLKVLRKSDGITYTVK